jgi:acyl-CoA reductase-like NAD-dependent aldehyde dehydrogenase
MGSASSESNSSRGIPSINPATQQPIAIFEPTPAAIPSILGQARVAQKEWAAFPLRQRCRMTRRLRDVIFDSREEIVASISNETGKPRTEAIFAELILALDTANFLARRAPSWLRPEPVPHHNFALKAKTGTIEFESYGVIGIISPWNFPFAIPMPRLFQPCSRVTR